MYELAADGTLTEHETVTLGTQADGFVTGTVGDVDGTTCRFGARWRASGPRTLEIDGSCDDDVARQIVLEFPEGDETTGLTPTVRVEGSSDWEHRGFQWAWRKCPALEGCVQSF